MYNGNGTVIATILRKLKGQKRTTLRSRDKRETINPDNVELVSINTPLYSLKPIIGGSDISE